MVFRLPEWHLGTDKQPVQPASPICLPSRSPFYSHFLLLDIMKFSPVCTNSVNGILCQKAREEGGKTPAFHLNLHLAGSTSLSYCLAGGRFFESLDPTQYPAQQSPLQVSEEDLAAALPINGILKHAPLSVGVSKMSKIGRVTKQAEESWQLIEKE